MGAVKLQWEQKYYRSCYVLRASHLLTSNTWVIVRTKGMELYTYWSAAYKFHKLNKVLCILHFFSDWSSSEGLCFMLIPSSKLCSTILFSIGNVYLHSGFASTHLSPLFLNLGVISMWNFRQPQHFLPWAFSVSHCLYKSHPCPFKRDSVQLISSLNDLKGRIPWSPKMWTGENLDKGIIFPSA